MPIGVTIAIHGVPPGSLVTMNHGEYGPLSGPSLGTHSTDHAFPHHHREPWNALHREAPQLTIGCSADGQL
jgi:hypothetical protein